MKRRFENRTVLVTGASRGLGKSIALAFAAEGAHVYIGYRTREEDAKRVVELVYEAGGTGALLPFDIKTPQSIYDAVDAVVAERGGVDVLVNNAAIVKDEPFALMSQESFDEVISVNLGGLFACSRAVVRSMLAKRSGAIINVGSVAGLHASPGQANYAASKGGVLALTKTLAAELAPRGIRVNAVVPGFLSTGMAARLDHRFATRARADIPLGRFGTAEEVASVVAFLASEEAAYIIGQAIVVDGGLSL